MLAAAMVLLAGLVLWRLAAGPGDAQVSPPPNEYVVFFADDLSTAAQKAALRNHRQAEFVQSGKLPGVTVVRLKGNVESALRALRQDPAVFYVQKSVSGMVCH